jgi:hypothetical protein
VLKKPKRQRLYGDGTELDTFDDLPTDRDKESQYHVQPKGHGNRAAGPRREKSVEIKDPGRGTIRKKSTRTLSMSGSGTLLLYFVLDIFSFLYPKGLKLLPAPSSAQEE